MATRNVIALLCLVLLAACGAEPVSTSTTNNPDVPVSLLFSIDGCRVYRFKDGGEFRYFASCPGNVSGSHMQYCGKACVRNIPESIGTVAQ